VIADQVADVVAAKKARHKIRWAAYRGKETWEPALSTEQVLELWDGGGGIRGRWLRMKFSGARYRGRVTKFDKRRGMHFVEFEGSDDKDSDYYDLIHTKRDWEFIDKPFDLLDR